MEPLVLVDGEYSASLDGITLDGKLMLEIKVPSKAPDSKLLVEAQAGACRCTYGCSFKPTDGRRR